MVYSGGERWGEKGVFSTTPCQENGQRLDHATLTFTTLSVSSYLRVLKYSTKSMAIALFARKEKLWRMSIPSCFPVPDGSTCQFSGWLVGVHVIPGVLPSVRAPNPRIRDTGVGAAPPLRCSLRRVSHDVSEHQLPWKPFSV